MGTRSAVAITFARRFGPALSALITWVLVGGISSTVPATPAPLPNPPMAKAENPPAEIGERSIDSDPLDPSRLRTCALDAGLLVSNSGELAVAVSEVASGSQLFGLNADDYRAPASVHKLLTALAAWNALGPDFVFTTTVVQGAGGEIWLVGGGDPTLTRSPGNNYYQASHSIGALAEQTHQALVAQGISEVSSLHVDTSRYESFSSWDETWRSNAWSLGFVAPVTSLQVDGDRDQPSLRLGRRSTDPVSRAEGWFADALGQAGAGSPQTGERSVAPAGRVLATVNSAPLPELLQIMLVDSDNTLAEAIAREVAIARGTTSLQEAILGSLDLEGADLSEVVIRDGSGLSPLNQLSANVVIAVLQEIASEEETAQIIEYLPVAGQTGSLRKRFITAGADAAGQVQAKTGSIQGVRSLAGLIDGDAAGQVFFSINVAGATVSDADRDRIDALVEGIFGCGENLAHWLANPEPNSE